MKDLRRSVLTAGLAFLALVPVTIAQRPPSSPAPNQGWPEMRGPSRDGVSLETNLPSRWSPSGENLAWKLPFGGRSTPVVFGNRLYLQTITPGDPALTQERLVAIEAESGKVLWERRFSVYLSDVPQHRAGWASPAVDRETGTIYVFTVGAELIALSPEGKVLWTRSLPEEYGAVTTHGGRTTSPIVEGDKVILNSLILAWGDLGRPGNRYFAFDKRTGATVWVSSPQTRHYDTNYSMPIVADVNGARLLIVGGTDGAYHAIKVNTGEPVWRLDVSKRAILNSALFRDNTAYITHGEENIDTTQMGMVAAIDATRQGELKKDVFKWVTRGFLPSFPSPVMDAERLYTVDNGAIVGAFDLETGKELWTKTLGTLQKGSPVLADGKLYVGTENGKFYILRPGATGAEVLDEDQLGTASEPDPIIASPAIAEGRVYLVAMGSTYAIGRRTSRATSSDGSSSSSVRGAAADPNAVVAHVQLYPYDVILDPGQKQIFTVRLYDAKGSFIPEKKADNAEKAAAVTWALDQLQGSVAADGTYAAPTQGGHAGYVKATVGGVTGTARVRLVPALPWSFDFESPSSDAPPMWWVGAPGKVFQRPLEGAGGVLLRPRDDTVGRRAKILMGSAGWSAYTIEADVRGREQRRQRGDVGLINQRYVLVLFGNAQKLELHPWQAADEMTVRVPYEWKLDAWYRMKLRVDHRSDSSDSSDGSTVVRGKVWPTGQPEPAAWTIEKIDKIPHVRGSPGIYADGISDVYFDNLRVYKNQ